MNELKEIIQTIEQHPSKMHVDNDGFSLVDYFASRDPGLSFAQTH